MTNKIETITTFESLAHLYETDLNRLGSVIYNTLAVARDSDPDIEREKILNTKKYRQT